MSGLKFYLKDKHQIKRKDGYLGYKYIYHATHPHVENSAIDFARIDAFLYVNPNKVRAHYKTCDYVIQWYSLINSDKQKLDIPTLIWTISDKGIIIPFTYGEENYSELLIEMMEITFLGRVSIRKSLKENTDKIIDRNYQSFKNNSTLNTK